MLMTLKKHGLQQLHRQMAVMKTMTQEMTLLSMILMRILTVGLLMDTRKPESQIQMNNTFGLKIKHSILNIITLMEKE